MSYQSFKKRLFNIIEVGYVEDFIGRGYDVINLIMIVVNLIDCILMTYEVGIRFLADYLVGDTYFKTTHETHNLERARNQFKLISDMEEKIDEMKAEVARY